MQYNAKQCNRMQYNKIQYSTIQYKTTMMVYTMYYSCYNISIYHIISYIMNMCIYICIIYTYMCVCVWERERERERETWGIHWTVDHVGDDTNSWAGFGFSGIIYTVSKATLLHRKSDVWVLRWAQKRASSWKGKDKQWEKCNKGFERRPVCLVAKPQDLRMLEELTANTSYSKSKIKCPTMITRW